jgi:hypothetical protein
MKKLSYLAFCLVLVAGFGCAITNYGIITDNDQVSNGQGSGIVNTAGKAHLFESSQIATIWPDGTDELFAAIDQKSDGSSTITTYNNFSTGTDPIFHDDLYCNTAWTGCAIWTASANDGNPDIFDGTWNQNCLGSRSLSLLLSTGRYYGECGDREAKLSVQDKVNLIDSAVSAKVLNMSGLQWNFGNDLRITATSNGVSYNLPLFGARISHFYNNAGNEAITDMTHASMAPALKHAGSVLRNMTDSVVITLTHNGVSSEFMISPEFAGNVMPGIANRY